MYNTVEPRVLEAAKLLFATEPHTALEAEYKQRGAVFSWESAPNTVRQMYIKRVTKMKAQFINLDFDEGAQALLNSSIGE